MKLLYKITLILNLLLYSMHNAESNETSFAELKTQLKSKNLMKLNTNIGNVDKAKLTVRNLLGTMRTNKKSRITLKGHKCKHTFNFNGKDYNDCTIDKAPDGQIPLNEWCFIYPSQETTDEWDYCKPNINNNKLRRKVEEIEEICSGRAKRGMDCDSGKNDVRSCVFQTENSIGAQKCNGSNRIIKVPNDYHACIESRGLFYCIPNRFRNVQECIFYCPANCEKEVCVASKAS